MRRIATALAMMLVGSVAFAQNAQTPQVTSLEVTEFGEYSLEVQSTDFTSEKGTPQRTVTGLKLLQQTRVMHLRKDLHFGFRFTLVGSPKDAAVELRMITNYPQPGAKPPDAAAPILRDESKRKFAIGSSIYRGFTIGQDWYMIPGDWTLEIWYGDQKLTSQTFTLVP